MDAAAKVTEEIETLIRARYPIIYLLSSEENRVREVVLRIANARQKKVFEWSSSIGLLPANVSIQSQKARNLPTRDPLLAFNEVIDLVEPALFLFKDLHPYLNRQQFAVIRRLKEIALHLKNSLKTVIILSPVLEIPVELEKEITVVSFPLPGRVELSDLLDSILDELRHSHVQIHLGRVSRERLLEAALGLTLSEAENVFAKIIVKHQALGADHVADVLEEKQQIIRKSGLLEYCAVEESFSEVGGLPLLKEWLQKRALAFSNEARAFGLAPPRGILLLGVQGCGKSLCAKAVSNQWQLPLLRFDMGRMFGSLVGSSEENVRRAIAVAESIAPAILWVDEIDKAFSGAQSSATVDGGTTARVFGTFLTWLSEKTLPVFVIATANDISQLPPELLRKGRFDDIFFIDLPSAEERAEILRIHLSKKGRDPKEFDIDSLVAASAGFSGSEIEEAVNSALYDAFYGAECLATHHVCAALAQTVPLCRTMAEHIQRLRAWADGRARHASVEHGAALANLTRPETL